MRIAPTAIGDHGARIKNSSTAIVELILDSLPGAGTPAKNLFTYLQGAFVSDLSRVNYFQCPFYIESNGPAIHLERVAAIVSELEQ